MAVVVSSLRSILLQRASLMVRGGTTITTTSCGYGAWNTCGVLGFSSSSSSSAENAQDKQRREVTVADKSSSSGAALQKRGRKPLWRRRSPKEIFFPFGFRSTDNNSGLFTPPASSKLGNALLQVSENLNRMLEGLTTSRFFRRFKEDDQCYKLQFEVPGLGKDDIKVTVEDGMLVIRGERKEDEGYEDEDEDEGWYYATRYGYYNTSLMLPEDAKVEEIKAEVRDGILYVTVPRSVEAQKKHVREVEVH